MSEIKPQYCYPEIITCLHMKGKKSMMSQDIHRAFMSSNQKIKTLRTLRLLCAFAVKH